MSEKTYRFPPAHTTGWVLGLTGPQCLLLATGALSATVVANLGAPWPAALAVFALGAVLAFLPVGDEPAHTAAAVAGGWTFRRRDRRWYRPLRQHHPDHPQPIAWPPAMGDIAIGSVAARSWPGRPVGVVVDRRARTVSATLAAAGSGFALEDPDHQHRLLAGWGHALAGFCGDHNPVTAITVTEWAAPTGTTTPQGFDDAVVPEAADAYQRLLTSAAPAATSHQTLITLTVPAGRNLPAALEMLAEHLQLLATRLDHARIRTDGPLTDRQLAVAIRRRLDPNTNPAAPNADGGVPDGAPMAWHATLRHVTVDSAVHAAFWVAGWPRSDVGPTWLEPLLLHPGGPRIVAVHLEPIAPKTSHRQVARDATRLAADDAQRARGGWRVGIGARRAADAVTEREQQLATGHAELVYAALVVVTAADVDGLERSCAEYEQAAAHAGLELRRLDGRHDLALAAALPTGRSIDRPLLG